jgi:hypothetical protein
MDNTAKYILLRVHLKTLRFQLEKLKEANFLLLCNRLGLSGEIEQIVEVCRAVVIQFELANQDDNYAKSTNLPPILRE